MRLGDDQTDDRILAMVAPTLPHAIARAQPRVTALPPQCGGRGRAEKDADRQQ